jgi:hypothetical protein
MFAEVRRETFFPQRRRSLTESKKKITANAPRNSRHVLFYLRVVALSRRSFPGGD